MLSCSVSATQIFTSSATLPVTSPKQIVHRHGGIEAVGVGIALEAIRGDQNVVNGILGFAEVYKGVVPLSQFFIVFTCKDELRLRVFHLANVNHVVATAQQEVDLCPRPLCSILVGLARGGP